MAVEKTLPKLGDYPVELDPAMRLGGANTAEDLAKMAPADPRRIASYVAMLLWETDDFEAPPPVYVTEALKDWKAHGDEMAPVLLAMTEQHPYPLGGCIADHLRGGGKVGIKTDAFLKYARDRYEGLDFSARDKKGEFVVALILGALGNEEDMPRVKRIEVLWKADGSHLYDVVKTSLALLTVRVRGR